MEALKKTILQAVTTGITACTGTTGTCYIIIPDLDAVYHLKIGLKQDNQDIGFFDTYVECQYSYYGDEFCGVGESLLIDDNFI